MRGFLQDVLGFLSPVRDAFVELATRAGSRVLVKTVRAQDLSATLNESMPPKLVQQGRTTIKANDFPAAAVREAFRLLNNVFFFFAGEYNAHTTYSIAIPVSYSSTAVHVYTCTVHRDSRYARSVPLYGAPAMKKKPQAHNNTVLPW